jgi:hypothetical protein
MVAVQARVAILGGDPTIGGSLEALLQAAGYTASYFSEDKLNDVGKVLADYQLLIVAPAASSELRRILLALASSELAPEIPVLELLAMNGEQIVRGDRILPWPCTMEELRLAIDSVLLTRE